MFFGKGFERFLYLQWSKTDVRMHDFSLFLAPVFDNLNIYSGLKPTSKSRIVHVFLERF